MPSTAGTSRPLLARICALDNLEQAWQRVRGKRAHGGLDGESVEEFGASVARRLEQLRDELLSERYVPEPALRIEIPKTSKPGERRKLGLPSVRDKVAQEAVRRVIEPRIDRSFLDCSYGYRAGRGPQRAVKRVAHHLDAGKCTFVAVADIDDFFDSVQHERLLACLRAPVADEAVLRLIELWLRMGAVDGSGRWRDVFGGVQQGSVIAPLLANAYLSPFDQSLTNRGFQLVRYADDFVLCTRERSHAEEALAAAMSFLTDRLGLRVNANPRPVLEVADGFAFLGIWFQGRERSITSSKLEGARVTLRRIVERHAAATAALHELSERAAGWRRYYGAVVEPRNLQPLEDLFVEALSSVVSREVGAGRVRGREGVRGLLRNVELVCSTGTAEREAVISAVAARAVPAHAPASAPAAPPTGNTRRLRRGTRTARPKATAPVPVPEAAATVVRRRKRLQLRRLVSTQELVVDTPGSFIGSTRGRIVVRHDRRTVCEVSLSGLRSITASGPGISLSLEAVRACAGSHVPVLVIGPNGHLEALAGAPRAADGRVALAQARALQAGRPAAELATRFVDGKVRAQMAVLKYLTKNRRRGDSALDGALRSAIDTMGRLAEELGRECAHEDLERARGRLLSFEGRAASAYWSIVGHVLRGRVEFPGRVRRGATDLVNSMLNYGYAVLQGRVILALARSGLEPQLSFLHTSQPGVPTLAFDLMEEFRAPVVDRAVIAILMRGREACVDAAGRLGDVTRRLLLGELLERLGGLLRWRGRECSLCDVVDAQARALAAHLTGGTRYRPYAFKW